MASITQYNAQKCHAYFEGYGNKNGRSWTHVYLKTHLFTPEKLYFTKIKNKKKLRSGAILRSGGDAKQVFFFIWPNKGIDKVNLHNMLHNKLVNSKVPIYFKEKEPPVISYKYTDNISRKVFNYNQTLSDVSLLRSHLHMAFPERDRWRAAAARKERVWGEKILTEGEGRGIHFYCHFSAGISLPFSLASIPHSRLASLRRSPQTLSFLAGDLAPEMPYGDDCGGG